MTRLRDSLDRECSMIWPVKPCLLLLKGLGQKFLLETNSDRLLAVMTRLGDRLDWGRSMLRPVKTFLLLLKGLGQEFLQETNLDRLSAVMTRLGDSLDRPCSMIWPVKLFLSLVKRPRARDTPRSKFRQGVGGNDQARGQPRSGTLHDLASEALPFSC